MVKLDLGPRHDAVKIAVRLQDGDRVAFFEKVEPPSAVSASVANVSTQRVSGRVGAAMMKGSFEADKALHEAIPRRVPKPVAWGTYVCDPDIHFYMAEFVEMRDDASSPKDWAAAVLDLHLASMGKSPGGQFGFHVTTHLANVPVDNSWTSSWEALWAQQMKSLFDQEESLNGPDKTLAELRTAYFEKAIPRYLRPLESDGRSITPCLIHSDLWLGNIKPRASTGELCVFDSCAYWGHNEGLSAIPNRLWARIANGSRAQLTSPSATTKDISWVPSARRSIRARPNSWTPTQAS